jgi:intracellular sulfur oxidation DsrE/DsrF family protein
MNKLLLSIATLALLTFNAQSAVNKIAIQISTDDARTQTIALNNAVNIQKYYGIDNVDIEIVAYGPGLGIMTKASKNSDRVESLALNDNMIFTACGNTMNKIKRKTGNLPILSQGVTIHPAGVVRLHELQQQGYSYIRP